MRLDGVNIGGMRLDGVDIGEARLNGDVVFFNPREYLQNGLMMWLDGANKTNASPTRTIWDNKGYLGGFPTDYAGVQSLHGFAFNSGSGWTGSSLRFDGVNDRVLQNVDMPSDVLTIEGVFLRRGLVARDAPFSTYSSDIGKGFCFCSGTAANHEKFVVFYNNTYISITEEPYLVSKMYSASMTFDPVSKNLYFYVNGVLIWSGNAYSMTPNKRFCVGRADVYEWAHWYNGEVFNVRVYDRFLKQSEVLHNYNIDKEAYGI